MEHIFVFDDDITMDVIIYDSTLKGRPSQISGIWRWKISFLQTMMTECLIVNNGRITTLLFVNFWAKHYYILWLACCNNGNICCVLSPLSNWCNSTVLWHLHTDMIKIRTIMATTTTVMMISQKLLSSWSTNKNGLLIKTQNIIFF